MNNRYPMASRYAPEAPELPIPAYVAIDLDSGEVIVARSMQRLLEAIKEAHGGRQGHTKTVNTQTDEHGAVYHVQWACEWIDSDGKQLNYLLVRGEI